MSFLKSLGRSVKKGARKVESGVEKYGKETKRFYKDKVVSPTEKFGKEMRRFSTSGLSRNLENPVAWGADEFAKKNPNSRLTEVYDDKIDKGLSPFQHYVAGGRDRQVKRQEYKAEKQARKDAPAPMAEQTGGMGERDSLLSKYGRNKTRRAKASTRLSREALGGR